MIPGTGRPTQFHAVPFEERAPDGKGGRLPYALEYPRLVTSSQILSCVADLCVVITLMPRVFRNGLLKRKAHLANQHDARLRLEREAQLQQKKKSIQPWMVSC